MKITPNIKALIRSGLETKGVPCVALTEHLNRPKSFTTKLFNGTLKNLTDADADAICDFLDIRFIQVTEQGRVSDTAIRLSKLMDKSPALAESITHLVKHLETTPAPQGEDVMLDTPKGGADTLTDRLPKASAAR